MTSMILDRLRAAAALMAAGMLAAPPAHAEEVVRFAYFKVATVLPFNYGIDKGYFKEQGIDLQLVTVPSGPAAVAALASGSADIAYSAPSPVILARTQNQPFRFFLALEYEQFPELEWGYLLASERSGVKSLKDMAGRSVVVGPPGGLCDVGFRAWLLKAGVPVDRVRFMNNPVTQMQAMLETGNADAACVPDPFATAILQSKVKPVTLSRGYLPEVRQKYRIDGVFASEDWIARHSGTIAGLKAGYGRAANELRGNLNLVEDILRRDYHLPPAVVEQIASNFVVSPDARAAEFQPMVDAMKETGFLSADFKASDLVAAPN